ncbi:16S rRNA (uracil(1498)-N(3))-methyltransferase [uncultured Desulfuromonas sp.]|uniref:16S rRNA (uracil(1498)-N(3))-methyltransferase n=1 Tax=uncultured Desulfuromonas sp. TaxID=181013 RepID=UPI00260C0EE5|nr:16S rRNA (uracil(1498)-N(3))-methyltransferase [uncultured Desulfuromonas sp.]
MNLILLFEEDFLPDGRQVRLTGRRLEHVRTVHRAKTGDELTVGLLGGRIGSGRVLRLDKEALEMEVALDRDPPPPLPLTLLLALPRPKVLRRTLQTAASMGVKRIVLLNAYRVEKSYWQSPMLGEEALREQLVLGLEQARDTALPEIELRPRFKPFVEDELPALAGGTRALVAHPAAAGPCPRASEEPVTLAIGPEGGFIPYEVEKLSECGFAPVTLGERILRVEAAVPALLSRLF